MGQATRSCQIFSIQQWDVSFIFKFLLLFEILSCSYFHVDDLLFVLFVLFVIVIVTSLNNYISM